MRKIISTLAASVALSAALIFPTASFAWWDAYGHWRPNYPHAHFHPQGHYDYHPSGHWDRHGNHFHWHDTSHYDYHDTSHYDFH